MTKSDKEKWDRKYAKQDLYQEVSQVVLAYQHWIPSEGKALDVAGGTGRHAIWLAQRGLDVSLVDVSSEALRQAAIRASEAGVELTTF